MNLKIHHKIISILLILNFYAFAIAQEDLNKEVEVTKAFIPVVSGADKINKLPEIKDTTVITPTFKYAISPREVKTTFQTEPLKAAQMVGEPLSELYGKYVKIGLGNYFTPMLEASIHNLRSKDYSFGAFFSHLSSAGKIKLINSDKKVYAGYFDDMLSAYGKKYFPNAIFSSNLGIEGYGRYNYGYNPSVENTLLKKDIRKRMFGLDFNSLFKSNYTDSLHFNYNINLNYFYFTDNYKNFENNYTFQTQLNKFYNTDQFGGDIVLNYSDNSFNYNTSDYFALKLSPWIGKFGTQWQVKVGLKIIYSQYSGNSDFLFYPVALLQYNIVNNYVVPYAGINGDHVNNNFRNIALENPYYNPDIIVDPTNTKFNLYGGVKGNISDISSFNIRASYSSIRNMYFYINDSTTPLRHTFGVEYDDVELTEVYAEFETRPVKSFTIGAKGNYYHYYLFKLQKPWHKPKYNFTLWWEYNMQNKIIFNSELFVIGQKYAKSNLLPAGYDIIDSAIDLNLGIEYNYTKRIKAFLNLNNLLGNNTYTWYYYPTQKFNFIFGVSYIF